MTSESLCNVQRWERTRVVQVDDSPFVECDVSLALSSPVVQQTSQHLNSLADVNERQWLLWEPFDADEIDDDIVTVNDDRLNASGKEHLAALIELAENDEEARNYLIWQLYEGRTSNSKTLTIRWLAIRVRVLP